MSFTDLPVDAVSVRVTNLGERKLSGQAMTYAGNEYTIEPGASRIMPYLAAVHFFGDPRSVNKGQARETQYRQGEVERLQVHWGTYDDGWYSEVAERTPGGNDELHMDWKGRATGDEPYVPHQDQYMHPSLPRVEVVLADTGEKLWTVIEDPAGDHNVVPDQSKLELNSLQQQYDQLKQRLDQIAAEVQFRDPGALAGPELDPIDNIPIPDVPEVNSEAIGGESADTIVDSLVDPEVPDVPATEDAPRRPAPKRKASSKT